MSAAGIADNVVNRRADNNKQKDGSRTERSAPDAGSSRAHDQPVLCAAAVRLQFAMPGSRHARSLPRLPCSSERPRTDGAMSGPGGAPVSLHTVETVRRGAPTRQMAGWGGGASSEPHAPEIPPRSPALLTLTSLQVRATPGPRDAASASPGPAQALTLRTVIL